MITIVDRYIVSNTNKDGGDSARAHGIADLFNSPFAIRWSATFVDFNGICVRHPFDPMYQNPWCFTRDQLICLTAGLTSFNSWTESVAKAKAIFWAHAKRFFFCQNFQRDYPGTYKFPWPHKMTGGDPADEGKWRMFDFADPLLPHHIWHLILCAQIKWLYWFKIFGAPLLWLSIRFNSHDIKSEQNQLICMVRVAGPWWVEQYKKYNPVWKDQIERYWHTERNCVEMSQLILTRF